LRRMTAAEWSSAKSSKKSRNHSQRCAPSDMYACSLLRADGR
jgi:hypothetical protein